MREGVQLLRPTLLNLETYQWHEQGRLRSLVSLMDWNDQALVIELAPPRQVQRWREGDALEGRLMEFLVGLGTRQRAAA